MWEVFFGHELACNVHRYIFAFNQEPQLELWGKSIWLDSHCESQPRITISVQAVPVVIRGEQLGDEGTPMQEHEPSRAKSNARAARVASLAEKDLPAEKEDFRGR